MAMCAVLAVSDWISIARVLIMSVNQVINGMILATLQSRWHSQYWHESTGPDFASLWLERTCRCEFSMAGRHGSNQSSCVAPEAATQTGTDACPHRNEVPRGTVRERDRCAYVWRSVSTDSAWDEVRHVKRVRRVVASVVCAGGWVGVSVSWSTSVIIFFLLTRA
jgi:hypothetical protein